MDVYEFKFYEQTSNYSSDKTITLEVKVKSLLVRKSILFYGEPERKRMQQMLLKWFWTHIFYIEEASPLIKFLLLFKKQKNEEGAIIKQIFNKTYICKLTHQK